MEKRRKKSSKQKWTNRDYHVQHNKDVENQGVKIYYATNQSPSLQFIGPHNKPHGNYRCSTSLYSFSILSQFYNMIIDRDISAPVHGREVL